MKKVNCSLLFFLFGVLVLSSCKKDPDDPITPNNPNESETITTMKLIFTEQGTSNELEFVFKDADGDGGAAPSIFDTIRLAAGTTYDVEILLLDESKTPTDTISHEVEEEGDEHQFFFTVTGGAAVTIDQFDLDDNGVPIGLMSVWATGSVTTDKNSKVKVVLKHQGADKPNTGGGNENIGDTDIEVNFPILIE